LIPFCSESFVFPSTLKELKDKIHIAIISPVALYECETWSVTVREKDRFRVFENTVLRRIFGPKREEVARGLRTLLKEEFHECTSHQM
jgi:hypothetical protein